MPSLLRPRGGRFTAGPLSVGVPLEGTDTVAGLRALERREAAARIGGLLDEAAKHGQWFVWGREGGAATAVLSPTFVANATLPPPTTQASTPNAATRATVVPTSNHSRWPR